MIILLKNERNNNGDGRYKGGREKEGKEGRRKKEGKIIIKKRKKMSKLSLLSLFPFIVKIKLQKPFCKKLIGK